MPGTWQCMPPCTASFKTHRALGIHRAKKPRCQKLYNDWLQSIVTEPGILHSMLGTMDEAIPEDMEIDPQPLGMVNPSSSEIEGTIQPSIREPTQAGCVTLHPTAGRVVDVVKAPFEQWRETMDSQGYHPYHPFESEIEFGLGAWLHESGISRDSINSFLKLRYVCILCVPPGLLSHNCRRNICCLPLVAQGLSLIASATSHIQGLIGFRSRSRLLVEPFPATFF